jgi:4'-phosphopantetheinyl transferase EntD
LTDLISRLLVPGLSGAEIWDEGQAVTLHPDEFVHVARSVDKRRREFALGRACARAALAGLGHGDAVIAKGDDGAAVWPAGIVGSITHTKGYAAALAAESLRFGGVGIDAECTGGVTPELWPRLFTLTEQKILRARAEPSLAATLFFCAKEASYKAWGLKGAPVFREIEIALKQDGFVATGPAASLSGCYAVEADVVLVAAWRGG